MTPDSCLDPKAARAFFLADEPATLALGAALSAVLVPGLVIWLHGDLGAGKTTLARGLLRGLGYAGKVKSPTFTLSELYVISNFTLYHFDFYRFADPEEWQDAGFRECFGDPHICLVEWPEKAGDSLPQGDLSIYLQIDGEGRRATVAAATPRGLECLSRLAEPPPA